MFSTLFILLGMIWLLQAIKFMDLLINKNASFSDFFLVSVLTIPDMLLILVPLSVFSGAYSGCKKMVLDSEMDAIYASGISRVGVMKPLLLLAFVATIFCYFISAYAIPKSRMSFYELKEKVRNDTDSLYIEPGIFNELNRNVTVYVQEIKDNQWMKNIIVYDNTRKELPVTWTAEEGVLKTSANNKPTLVLLNGTRQEMNAEQTSVLEFKSHQIDLTKESEDEKIVRPKKSSERYIHELLKIDHLKTDKQINKFKGEFYKRILWPLAPFSLVLIPLFFLFKPVKKRFGLAKPSIYSISFAVLFIILQMVFNSQIVSGSYVFIYLAISLEIIVPLVIISLLIKENSKG